MTDSHFGQGGLSDDTSELNRLRFLIRQELAHVRTGVPVKVIAVHGGGVGAAPTVDLQPMVNQTDGVGNKTDHGIIYGVPATRSQGGGSAVINDPKVGDIGYMQVADRDISALKANEGSQSNPGSFRRHDMADGVYVGAMLNPANPNQYVQFTDTGVRVVGVGGGVMEINGPDMFFTGTLNVSGDVIAGDGAVSLLDHLHTQVTAGADLSGPPEEM